MNNFEQPGELSGLCYREKGEVLVSPVVSDFTFEDYLVPNRDLLPPDLYRGINDYVPAFGIETKRGCPLSCAYCIYPRLQGKSMRCRKPADVVDELEMLHDRYGLRDFHFNRNFG
ncbi:hypothetical protein [Desulfolucanica intricata]|uniref:hypothetical protein n=1 Tax=Desulfolucanica intricata TaxID=1285191 RepID=UPI000833C124|nr:hypothetical protein [Desulfolucanica intricata]